MSDWGSSSPVPRVGDLIETTDGTWITKPPYRCAAGHLLGPGQVLVGHIACMGHGGGGHTLWHCLTCPQDAAPVYGPPLGAHCSVLAGPAAVR